jgi:hypothetical protein
MTPDDKFGLGAGFLALGLAGGLILLAQLLPPSVFQLPPRQPMLAEQIFDGLVFLIGVPVGIYFFYQGARTKSDN